MTSLKFIFFIAVFSGIWSSFNKISVINNLKKDASQAYLKKDYNSAIKNYREILEKYEPFNEKVLINFAHCSYKTGDTSTSSSCYKKLLNSQNPSYRSIANLQLGVIQASQGRKNQALKLFIFALKEDPGNYEARFNYELVKKLLLEEQKGKGVGLRTKKEKQQRPDNSEYSGQDAEEDQNSDQENDTQNPQSGNESGDNSGFDEGDGNLKSKGSSSDNSANRTKSQQEKESLASKKMLEQNIPPGRARMILESMRNSEIQYLQQRKRIIKKDNDQQDW